MMKQLNALFLLLAPVAVQAQESHHQYFKSHSECMSSVRGSEFYTAQGRGIYCTCRLKMQKVPTNFPRDDVYYCWGYGRGLEDALAGVSSSRSKPSPQTNIYDVMIESLRSRSNSSSLIEEYLRSSPYAGSIMKAPNISF